MELGQTIAWRTFTFGDKTAELGIGLPHTDDDGKNNLCPFQVVGIGDEKVRHAGSVDALQALLLCVERASMNPASRPEVKAGQVTFWGLKELGFRNSDSGKRNA